VRASRLAGAGDDSVAEVLLEAMLLATLCAHPAHVPVFAAEIEALPLAGEGHDRLRDAILAAGPDGALSPEGRAVLDRLMRDAHVRVAPPVRPGAGDELVRMCLAEGFAKLSALRGARAEIAEAAEDLGGLADEGVTWRLAQAARALEQAQRRAAGVADGRSEDHAALSRRLDELLETAPWIKKKP
jgi:DNA primase